MEHEQLVLFYESISTEKKRQLLEEAGLEWPKCDCCGIPKIWHPTTLKKAGGSWKKRCTYRLLNNRSLNKNYYTPGTYRFKQRIQSIEDNMQKYIPGTEEYNQHIERIRKSWTI